MDDKGVLIEKIQVHGLKDSVRLSDLPVELLHTFNSKKSFRNAIKSGNVYCNNFRGNSAIWVNNADQIHIYQKHQKPKPAIELSYNVLFEDDFLAVINKPAGVVVSGNKKITLENSLAQKLIPSTQPDALIYPEPIHRLDYPTTGALLVGKTRNAVQHLNKMFERKSILKTYLAITQGTSPKEKVITLEVKGKQACSHVNVLLTSASQKYTYLNLVKITPETGRKHQIRQHLASLGTPIFGDKTYGNPQQMHFGNGLYLHAYSLSFSHPITHAPLRIEAPIPKKFTRIFGDFKL